MLLKIGLCYPIRRVNLVSMATNIQQRSGKFQLRVSHKLLPKPFFFTFLTQPQAESYRDQLMALLVNGIVPQEMLSKPKSGEDPMLPVVIRDYVTNTPVTDSDDALLALIRQEVIGVRVSGVTFAWTEDYVRQLKSPEHHLAPSSIRKRVGALARVMDWHLKRVAADGSMPRANPLRIMARGYSAYSKEDAKLVEPKVDVVRNRRLSQDDAARILAALDGVKREDRERPFTDDKAFGAYFSDRGRLFQSDRGRRFSAIVDAQGCAQARV